MRTNMLLGGLLLTSVVRSSEPAAAPAPKGWPAGIESVEYQAGIDKTQQPMLVYAAPVKEKRPLLVGLHTWSGGYTQAGGEAVYARWCIEHDWHFIHPHFRGPNWTPEACGSEKAVQDILDAVTYMKQNHAIDADRIYMAGVSGGGYAALLMAGRAPEIWAGVSAWASISDIHAWWKQKSQAKSKYAEDIEKAVGGVPDKNKKAAEKCVKRSAVTYLPKAALVNLDINAGVTDGHKGGSVPFTHSLNAFNAVADVKHRLDPAFIEAFYNKQALPEAYPKTETDPLYGKKQVVFRKTSGNTRITIFKGGHEIIHRAALNWLAAQRRGASARWNVTQTRSFKVTDTEEKAQK